MTLLTDFARVTRRKPCPICGRPDWCLVSKDSTSDPSSAICKRVLSERSRGNAGYFHRLHDRSECTASAAAETHIVRWSEDAEEHEIIVRVNRWTKHGKDRLYVAAVLPEGGMRELGNYDLVQEQWYTKGTIRDLSRQRQDATKTLVLGIVAKLGGRS